MAEQLICNQQVAGSSPITSSSEIIMDGFPSGQRERTVNPLSQTTMVRIHPRPPFFYMREWRNWQTRTVQVRMGATSCRFKSCFPHQLKSNICLPRQTLLFYRKTINQGSVADDHPPRSPFFCPKQPKIPQKTGVLLFSFSSAVK